MEPELAFCDLAGLLRCVEAYVRHCAAAVLARCGEDLDFLAKRYDANLPGRAQVCRRYSCGVIIDYESACMFIFGVSSYPTIEERERARTPS